MCHNGPQVPLEEGDDGRPVQESAAVPLGRTRKTRWDRLLDLTVGLAWAVVAAVNLDAILKGGDALDLSRLVYYTLIAYLFVRRRPATRKGAWWENILAWGGALLPMVGLRSAAGGWIVLGLLVQGLALLAMILALASLGRSFGVAPADRGLVRRGLYQQVRHPLYAAELWFLVGYLIANPSWRNLAVLVISVGIHIIRILREEKILSGYTDYANEVRWRLLPLVW